MNDVLSNLVTGAAAKRLTAVEAMPTRSNQHEFNCVQALKVLFGESPSYLRRELLYVRRDEEDLTPSEGFVTWYDPARTIRHDSSSASTFQGQTRPRGFKNGTWPSYSAAGRLGPYGISLGGGSTAEHQLSSVVRPRIPRGRGPKSRTSQARIPRPASPLGRSLPNLASSPAISLRFRSHTSKWSLTGSEGDSRRQPSSRNLRGA